MKTTKAIIWCMVLMIIVGAVYRVFPNRPWGFAPQWAMALFGGAVIRDKKWAFALPLLSMLVSDVLYHFLYSNNLSPIPGFYSGQLTNYILFAVVTVIGFLIKPLSVGRIALYSLAGPTVFFILSNFILWMGGGGLQRPKTFQGLMMCYTDALPFYQNSLLATLFFSTVLFGSWMLITRKQRRAEIA
jgi:hypothetical protein